MLRSHLLRLIALLGIGLAISACGSSRLSRNRGSSGQALAYVHCMRSHGVPKMPDPSAEGAIQLPADINPSAPAFKAALAKCRGLMPSGTTGGHQAPTQQAIDQLLALSRCMRAHGITGLPDPTLSGPPSNPEQYSIAFGRGGVSLLIPKTVNVSSPAFKQAAVACRLGALLPKGQRTPVGSS